ncbi:MAG: Smr/MutS family protein [Thermodesulfovibrionales bacterium]|nr:Smr/MutS family protein [Thermodesulfovibrionales bacterium]
MSKRRDNFDDFAHRPFRGLKDIIHKKGLILSEGQQRSQAKELSDEELFFKAMEKVKEIKEYRMLKFDPIVRHPFFVKIKTEKSISELLSEIIEGKVKINLRDTQEYVEWLNPKYSAHYRKDILRRLHEKSFAVQDYIDLHGLTVDEAEKAVEIFIRKSLRNGLRCIKFIHGRGLRSPTGRSALKEALIKWLTNRYHKYVIAFVTAPYFDGGLGAMYVLLRRRTLCR